MPEAIEYLIDVADVTTYDELRNAIQRGLGVDCGHTYELLWFLESLSGPILITVSGLSGLAHHLPTHATLFQVALRDAAELGNVSVRFV